MDRHSTCILLPASDSEIDIERLHLHPVAISASTFRGHQCCSRPEKTIEHYLLTSCRVENRVCHHSDGFYRRMEICEIPFGLLLRHGMEAWILPDIGSVAPKLTKLDIVAVPL